VELENFENKKPSNSGKTENEGIQRILPKTVRQAGLILLFDGEVGRSYKRPRRAQPNRYPDFGFQPPSRLPAVPSRAVALGICSRYSGATVPDFHRVPEHLTARVDGPTPVLSKNNPFLHWKYKFAKKKISSTM